MFDSTSRYYNFETATLNMLDSEGNVREVKYIRRRFIPRQSDETTLVEHTIAEGDRLDNVTAKYLGDPLQFWRVCDANNAMNATELTEEVGTVVHITLPQLR